MPPYWFLQRWKVASLIPRSFATCGTEVPAASFASASRSLRTICSGVWRLFFTESPPPSLAHLEQSDSHGSWISFRGAGHLEVPNTFDELLASMRGFIAFAICFAVLLTVWFEQYKFFRRYGLNDNITMRLNAVLLFFVLFYVYPLKFLFTAWIDQLLGFSTQLGGSTENVIESIEPGQWPLLIIIFGAGFVVVQLVFVLLCWRAYALRGALELDVHEASITRQEIQGFLILTGIGLASIAIAILGGEETTSWAGGVYAL